MSTIARKRKYENLKVDIRADVTDTLIHYLRTRGVKIIFASKEYRSIRAETNLLMVEKIAAYSAVKFIEPAAIPMRRSLQPKLNP